MNMADRIQTLRKSKNISQEQLADKLGVSRQAVSKWESQQTIPDINKIILLSDYFEVTTDYLLKGIEPIENDKKYSNSITSKILYISSTALYAIGLLCAFGGWYAYQSMEVIWWSMIIQVLGIIAYYVGGILSNEKPSPKMKWFNIALLIFMPVSILCGLFTSRYLFVGMASPYPIGFMQTMIFIIIYSIINYVTYRKIVR